MTAAHRIMVADDDQALTRTLTWILKENGYEVISVPNAENLLERLVSDDPDLLLLDIMMPKVDGLQLLERIKQDPRRRDLPVLMISSMPPEEATVRALGLGASDFIAKPFRVRELLARVKAHLRVGRELNLARAAARSREEVLEILREISSAVRPAEIFQVLVKRVARGLKIAECSVVLVNADGRTGTVMAAYENPLLHDLPVDLARYPEIRAALAKDAVVLVQDIKSDPLFTDMRERWKAEGRFIATRSAIAMPFRPRGHPTGVFFLRTTQDELPLNQVDADFAGEVLRAAVPALEKAYDLEQATSSRAELMEMATTDPLTGVANRRALASRLEAEFERTGRYGGSLSLLLVDIDDFKHVNDTFGHQAGDNVLVQLAGIFTREQRTVDLVSRFGGEEFVIMLPETNAVGAANFAERVLQKVADHDFGDPAHAVKVTVSIGIATYPDGRATDVTAFLSQADAKLYQAKRDGRNRYCA
ncbi:MAG TPA: diguanylate cyclase [Gemmatimonadales bacterium]|nr:diguanylate cyclase [Gemmatimonadales bacterium]